MANKNNKKKTGLISSIDIKKGFTSLANNLDIWSLQPLQCVPLEEKDEDWIKWNADWWENIALRELPNKAKRLQKLYNLASGVIDRSDYEYNPDNNELSNQSVMPAINDKSAIPFSNTTKSNSQYEMPANSKIDYTGHSWECKYGFKQIDNEKNNNDVPLGRQTLKGSLSLLFTKSSNSLAITASSASAHAAVSDPKHIWSS